jgi:hypothetical protein
MSRKHITNNFGKEATHWNFFKRVKCEEEELGILDPIKWLKLIGKIATLGVLDPIKWLKPEATTFHPSKVVILSALEARMNKWS